MPQVHVEREIGGRILRLETGKVARLASSAVVAHYAESAVLATWALELGLGVLESVGLEPRSAKGWSDIHNRMARGLQLAPDRAERKPSRRPAASRRNG